MILAAPHETKVDLCNQRGDHHYGHRLLRECPDRLIAISVQSWLGGRPSPPSEAGRAGGQVA